MFAGEKQKQNFNKKQPSIKATIVQKRTASFGNSENVYLHVDVFERRPCVLLLLRVCAHLCEYFAIICKAISNAVETNLTWHKKLFKIKYEKAKQTEK